ncbi:hypothetical protein CRUP_031562 [Coryphaenoides rupestris]|nr:hypothetical protein CRUP_031562 [Coryphaenoides rupestris]
MTARKQPRRAKPADGDSELKVFDFSLEDKKLSSEEDPQDEAPVVDKLSKKRGSVDPSPDRPEGGVGNEVQSMLERFGADISKVMQAKRKRLKTLTETSLKGSHHKLEQLWNSQYTQRQKLTQDYSQQVSSVLQQWETEALRVEEQEEKLNVGFECLSPGFECLSPGFECLSPGFERLSPGFERLSPGFECLSPGFERLSPGFERLSPGFERLSPGFERLSPGFERLSPGFECLSPGFERLSPGFERLSPGFERLSPGFERLSPGFERLSPGFECLNPGFDVNQHLLSAVC